MKKKNLKKFISYILCLTLAFVLMTGCGSKSSTESTSTTVYGKIKAISGNSITLALATKDSTQSSAQPAASAATASSSDTQQSGDQQSSSQPMGTPPSGGQPSGNPPAMPGSGSITLTGEEKIITVSDTTTYTVSGASSTLDKLATDNIVTVQMTGDTVVSITVESTSGSGAPGGTQSGSNDSSSVETKGVKEITDTQTLTGETYNSDTADTSPIVVSDGGNLTVKSATLTKTGDTSSADNSNFAGLNAGLLAKSGSTITVSDTTVTTDAEGANAIFSTGTNSTINVSNVTVNTSKNSSRGLDATYGGTINGDNVTISTKGDHCAALATDRGEGTVTVKNSSLNTAGAGSPCIYSTGKISATNTTGKATGSSLAVIEGKNSITLDKSTLEGSGIGRTSNGIDTAGIMIYQSTSGDASEGTGTLTSTDSTLTISKDSSVYKTAPMFFVTNTDAVFTLKNTTLNFGSGILLNAAGNTGEWGTQGSNGGIVTLNAENQTLEGSIHADNISTIKLNLTNSNLTSTINKDKTAKEVSVTLDKNSKWNVTGTSYITSLTNADTTCSNIISNGNTVYYDSSNSANSWLNGSTIQLSGGGVLTPAK